MKKNVIKVFLVVLIFGFLFSLILNSDNAGTHGYMEAAANKVVDYIKQKESDKAIRTAHYIANSTGKFNEPNYSIQNLNDEKLDGYYDSINKTATFLFDMGFDLDNSEKYLTQHKNKAMFKNLRFKFRLDSNLNFIEKTTFVLFTDSTEFTLENNKVPDGEAFINQVKLEEKSAILKEQARMAQYNSSFWSEFDPIVKERVVKMIEDKDCIGLQKEFNTTADNLDRLQAAGRSGSRNLDLMEFIDSYLRKLNCY